MVNAIVAPRAAAADFGGTMSSDHVRHCGATRSEFVQLTLAELLTGWLANVRELRAPDTLDDCADYARHLEASQRIKADAAALCERLQRRVSTLVDVETHNANRLLNRLTPPG
jgi:hypothetical protein